MDKELEDLIRLHKIGRAYLKALKDEGLWEPGENGWDPDHHMKKWAVQRRFDDGNLPLFFLDKIETKQHADDLAEDLIEEFEGSHSLSEDEFYRRYWGRPNHDRDMPDLILSMIEYAVFTSEAAVSLMRHAWMNTEFPSQNADPERWVDNFTTAGWVSDDDSPRPTEPIRLYRGAELEHAAGMSWTASVDTARWFANRWTKGGEVFWAIFQPDELLARFTTRNEDEYVVDTVYLDNLDRIKTLTKEDA